MDAAATPRLAPGVRLSEDAARGRTIVMAPERVFVPDETALEVLRLLDGARSVDTVVDTLAARFAAPREVIAEDVGDLLRDLVERGVVAL